MVPYGSLKLYTLTARYMYTLHVHIPIGFVNLITKASRINNGELQVHVTFSQLCTL